MLECLLLHIMYVQAEETKNEDVTYDQASGLGAVQRLGLQWRPKNRAVLEAAPHPEACAILATSTAYTFLGCTCLLS